MSEDDSNDGARSRKERARLQRRAAYRAQKERRDKDPRYIAMKAAMRERQKAAYQQIKEKRKAASVEAKNARARQQSEERAAMDAELMKLVQRATKGPHDIN